MEWMLMPYRRYFDFSGRSRRKEYWMFVLLTVIVAVVLVALMFGSGFPFQEFEADGSAPATPGPLFWVSSVAIGLFSLATIIPSIAVQVRRFHDQDRSGWMVLLAFIPYVGGLIVFVFMCLEGTRGPNRYGPDPKDPTSADVFS